MPEPVKSLLDQITTKYEITEGNVQLITYTVYITATSNTRQFHDCTGICKLAVLQNSRKSNHIICNVTKT